MQPADKSGKVLFLLTYLHLTISSNATLRGYFGLCVQPELLLGLGTQGCEVRDAGVFSDSSSGQREVARDLQELGQGTQLG